MFYLKQLTFPRKMNELICKDLSIHTYIEYAFIIIDTMGGRRHRDLYIFSTIKVAPNENK